MKCPISSTITEDMTTHLINFSLIGFSFSVIILYHGRKDLLSNSSNDEIANNIEATKTIKNRKKENNQVCI